MDYGVLKTGGTSAGIFDLINTTINRGTASNATQPTSGSQPIYLPLTENRGYGYLPGVAGNYFSIPNLTEDSITGDIDIRVKLCPASWHTSSANMALFSKWYVANYCFVFAVNNRKLVFYMSPDGSGGITANASDADITLVDGVPGWVRVTRQVSDGELKFYESIDGTTWTQVGSAATVQPGVNLFDSDENFEIGTYDRGTGSPIRYAAQHVQVFASLNGTDKRLDADFTDTAVIDNATSFACSTGQVVTANKSGNNPALVIRRPSSIFEGFDDWLRGTYNTSFTGARLFVAYQVLGNGGQQYARVFGSGSEYEDYSGGHFMLIRNNGGTNIAAHQGGNFRISDSTSYQGKHVFEALFEPSGGDITLWRDNTEIGTVAADQNLNVTHYAIGGRYLGGDGQAHAAIRFFGAWLVPHDADPVIVEDIRNYVLNKYLGDVYIYAPEGAFAGGDLVVQGGIPPYQLTVNGVNVGATFTTTNTTIPLSVTEDDEVRVWDSNGKRSNILAVIDPLVDLPLALRLQTHNGDNVPLGLYQDDECTVPSAVDGSPVGGWSDELTDSERIFGQTTETKRSTLKFVSGKPVVRFDGIDDALTSTRIPLTGDFTLVVRLTSSGDSVIASDYSIPTITNEQILRIWNTGNGEIVSGIGGAFDAYAGIVARSTASNIYIIRSGGVTNAYQNGTLLGEMTVDAFTGFGCLGALYVHTAGFLNPMSGDVTAVLLSLEDLTDHIDRINNYLNTL
jgi:hypothetical protein